MCPQEAGGECTERPVRTACCCHHTQPCLLHAQEVSSSERSDKSSGRVQQQTQRRTQRQTLAPGHLNSCSTSNACVRTPSMLHCMGHDPHMLQSWGIRVSESCCHSGNYQVYSQHTDYKATPTGSQTICWHPCSSLSWPMCTHVCSCHM
jgi:hypothetical protein